MPKNQLFYGDNLDVLRQHVPASSVDLVYLDPPFNSARNYNLIFNRHDVAGADSAQIQAFGDTWKWTPVTDEQYDRYVGGELPNQGADAEMGLMILNAQPTRGMVQAVNRAGTYQNPHYANAFPRVQIITVGELLSGVKPNMPPVALPYVKALRATTPADQDSLFGDVSPARVPQDKGSIWGRLARKRNN